MILKLNFGPKNVHTLIKFVSGLAKQAIWISRKNRVCAVGRVDPEQMTEGLLVACLRVEYACYQAVDKLKD